MNIDVLDYKRRTRKIPVNNNVNAIIGQNNDKPYTTLKINKMKTYKIFQYKLDNCISYFYPWILKGEKYDTLFLYF